MEILITLSLVIFTAIMVSMTSKGRVDLPVQKLPEPPVKPVEPVKPVVVAPMPKAPEKPAGVDYGRWPGLVKAIIKVESSSAKYPNGYDNAIGDKHLKDKAYGPMQIRKPVCLDVNRVYKTKLTPEAMLGNRQLSIDTFYKYMDIYCTKKQLGVEPTDEIRARCWNGGPTGWKRPTTAVYWTKIKQYL